MVESEIVLSLSSKLKDMEFKRSKLLTTNNFKTTKGEKYGYTTYIMYMSPYTDNSKGINLCSHASAGCAAACLFKSGMGGMYKGVQNGRRNKSEWYLADRQDFLNTLDKEISNIVKKHGKDNSKFAIRLNGTSDIRWEKLKVRDGKCLFELYPDVQFYDYTKNPNRFDGSMPNNYHLTFSRSECNNADAMSILAKGYNVAIVFNKLPETYNGYKVISGDESDLRFLDESGVIIGLKYKFATGKNADNKSAFESGFAITI